MEKLLNEDVQKMLKDILVEMKDDVHVKLYVDSMDCDTCTESHQLMSEISELNDKLHYELIEGKNDEITSYPMITILDKNQKDKGVYFKGIPAGHEINAFLSALIDVSGKPLDLDEETIKRIKAIDKPTNIKVFVTLSCPHCSGAVSKAHRIAMLNENVQAEMIEAQTFHDLSNKYQVSSVPKIVINDEDDFVGNQPLNTFLEMIESAA